MRVSSNFHPPLICCSKSPVLHSPQCPPKSKPGDFHDASTSPAHDPLVMENDSSQVKVKFQENCVDEEKVDILPKSSMKKPGSSGKEQACRGNVKWLDLVGKDLTEIREFEPSEYDDSDDDFDGNASCSCTIQ